MVSWASPDARPIGLPTWILHHAGVTDQAFRTWMVLASVAGRVDPSQPVAIQEISRLRNKSRRVIFEHLDRLEAVGLLRRERRTQSDGALAPNHYVLAWDVPLDSSAEYRTTSVRFSERSNVGGRDDMTTPAERAYHDRIRHHFSRRRFLVGAGATVVLAACGGDTDSDASSPPSSTASDTSPPSSEGAASAGFPRTVEHVAGSVTLDGPPEALFVADGLIHLDYALALGVRPVGFAIYDNMAEDPEGPQLPPWIVDALDGDIPPAIGNLEPNLERLAEIGPDVVIRLDYHSAFDPAADFADLVEPPEDFAGTARLLGSLYGLEAEAEALIAERAAQLDSVAELAAANPRSFTFANTFSERSAWVYNPGDTFLPGLLADAGVELVGYGDPAEFQVNVAEENLTDLDAEYLVFVQGFGSEAYDDLALSPIFQDIPAVRAGRVRVIDGDDATALLWPGPLAMPRVAEVLRSLYE
ncbi:MAG: ABC transporter substrate-binding protein [Actinomycetota bacterium]